MNAGDNLVQAARSALADAMEAEDAVMLLGEDVGTGGPFGLTRGLADKHGVGRVRNTPICEGSFVGAAVGLALAGGRPFVDIMFDDFATLASDQLFNNAAKIHFMSGGRYSVPLTIWTVAGAEGRWGAQHSQSLAGWFAQVPGIKVLSPSSPKMMYSSVLEALTDPDPVVLFVDRRLLYSRAELPGDDGSPWQARVIKGGSDVTVAASGSLAHSALEAAHAFPDGVVEVIDLQRLAPIDVSVIVESVARTSRLVIAHDEARCGGIAAAVASEVYERGYWSLEAPIQRVTCPPTPVPFAGPLEDAYVVSATDIVDAIALVRE